MTDNELVKAEREKELVECLTWLQHRMDEYDDKEAYQDDYKMASIAWNFIRARIPENAELKEAQRWVPVGERLPERYEPVLIYNPMWVYPVMSMLRDDDEFWTGSQVVTPTHWQPLPAAPKGE